MTPFKPAKLPKEAFSLVQIMVRHRCSLDKAAHIATSLRHEKVYLNDQYQVNIREVEWPGVGKMQNLSIKRRDKGPVHDWRDFQTIKNELVGPECEGFELYPAESRLMDTANQYHLFVFMDPGICIPLGFNVGRHVGTAAEAEAVGAVQREPGS